MRKVFLVAGLLLTMLVPGLASSVNLEYNKAMETGWNLVSLPYSSMGYDPTSACPVSQIYFYNSENHSYQAVTINNAPGG